MRPVRSLLVLVLAGCGPLIHVPAPAEVQATPRTGRTVEVCVAFQERGTRAVFEGVAELSFARWDYAIASVVVKHPAGLVVIDPAFGEAIGDELRRAGPFARLLFGDERTKRPLTAALRAAGIAPEDVRLALVTHVHWDHTGALRDLPGARVLAPKADLAWAQHFHRYFDHGAMPHHLDAVKERLGGFDFTGPPVDGFPASFDVLGDGSIVAVPLPGHTPGSTGYLVRAPGRTLLLAGDTTWTLRGVELPAHKNPLARLDDDERSVAASIGRLTAFLRHRPDVLVVPAHEGAQLSQLPACEGPAATVTTP